MKRIFKKILQLTKCGIVYRRVNVSIGHIRLVEEDGHFRHVIDPEWRRKAGSVAEYDAVRALLLDNFDADEQRMAFRIADVNVERADVADGKSARPVTARNVQKADAQQLILVQTRPMER